MRRRKEQQANLGFRGGRRRNKKKTDFVIVYDQVVVGSIRYGILYFRERERGNRIHTRVLF
jgi:hypothetical protein